MEQEKGQIICDSRGKLIGRKDEYLIYVAYGPLTSVELTQEFSRGKVSYMFDGRPFQMHGSCMGVNQAPCHRVFWVAKPPSIVLRDNRKIVSEKIIAWGDKQRPVFAPNGYRPANHLELFAFAKARIKITSLTVALGSFVSDGENLCVIVLGTESMCLRGSNTDSDERFFGCSLLENLWCSDHRFLFVRKDAEEMEN